MLCEIGGYVRRNKMILIKLVSVGSIGDHK